jgi:uncharacterized protein (DUF2336 family)
MPMSTPLTLLAELDDALAMSATERRSQILQKVADLFVLGAADYSDDQIALFDDVFTRLVANIETGARAALAARLAPIAIAPPGVSRMLAADEAVTVAAPLLERCERLDAGTLVGTARTRSQGHLLAISRRRYLDEVLTDVLVERGNRSVVLSTAENLGARFSDFGFATLVRRSEGDDGLASCVGSRRELPRHHLLKLLAKASDTVRRKLELADPLGADAIRNAVAEAASLVQARTNRASRNYAAAQAHIDAVQASGELNESAVAAFAGDGKVEETTVALARLCDMPIESIELAMVGERPEAILILAKAIGMSWPTAKALLGMRQNGQGLSKQALEQCLGTFSRMKPATARQVLSFQRKRSQIGSSR